MNVVVDFQEQLALGLGFRRAACRRLCKGEPYDDFVDWPAGETLDNVAYAFARLLALPHYKWLRWRDDLSDEEQDAVKVSSRRRQFPLP